MQIGLENKTILLGVTGSISAYKACEIARLFIKAGATVHVVMTPAAERFVTSLSFEALTRNPVLTEKTESWSSTLNHIDIGKPCDLFVIAPATANTLNKLSHGIADNILTQCALAFHGPKLLAPAANTQMLANHASCETLLHLKANHYTIVSPQIKTLACGDTGSGALADPEEIFYAASKVLYQNDFWKNRAAVVTGGGTREKIDEVRYLSNFSSGMMAKSIALWLYLKGAHVTYITSTDHDGLPQDITIIQTEDTHSLLTQTQNCLNQINTKKDKTPYLFMVSAVSDYTPLSPATGKLKKTALGERWDLTLTQTPDILSTLDKKGIKTIAFKAEMDAEHGLENARNLLVKKNVDAVCYNLLKDSHSFGTRDNAITFITKEHEIDLGRADKLTLAQRILTHVQMLEEK